MDDRRLTAQLLDLARVQLLAHPRVPLDLLRVQLPLSQEADLSTRQSAHERDCTAGESCPHFHLTLPSLHASELGVE